MSRISNSVRVGIALAIWALGLVMFLGLGLWNITSSRHDAENRLLSEAGRTAAQIASLLSLPGSRPDSMSARAIAGAAMEDERIYAIRIQTRQGILEGQRRNYMWEPVPWDDEIAENCVQGVNPVKTGGRPDGVVEVWLSPRSSDEDASLLSDREKIRFFVFALIWTLVLFLVFWQWGVLRSWLKRLRKRQDAPESDIIEKLAEQEQARQNEQAAQSGDQKSPPVINAKAGHEFQRRHPDSWNVTAGMFRQTFAHAPRLISRLYAEGELAGLCHLGRMLEQAAPCIGAEPLIQAARKMQAALNDPDCETRALPVEECARILEQTLAALASPASPRPAVSRG